MKKNLISLIFLCLSTLNYAQVSIGLVNTQLFYQPFDISRHTTLDSSLLIVSYTYLYNDADIKKGAVAVNDMMELQIGSSINKFYSKNLHLMDRASSFDEELQIRTRLNYTPFEVFTDNSRNRVNVVYREPFSNCIECKAIQYDEPKSEIMWTLDSDTTTIAGYQCNRARAYVSGREWIVWYTTEIPIQTGPWKLYGLPGLIMKAQDKDSLFVFTAIGLEKKIAAICKYNWNYSTISKKSWLILECGFHEQPYLYFIKEDKGAFDFNTGKKLDTNWSIPYNAIELK